MELKKDKISSVRTGFLSPFLVVLLFFGCGVYSAQYFELRCSAGVLLAAIFLLLLMGFILLFKKDSSVVILLSLFTAYLLMGVAFERAEEIDFLKALNSLRIAKSDVVSGTYCHCAAEVSGEPNIIKDINAIVVPIRIIRLNSSVIKDKNLTGLLTVYDSSPLWGHLFSGVQIRFSARLGVPRGYLNEGIEPLFYYYWNRGYVCSLSCKSASLITIVNHPNQPFFSKLRGKLEKQVNKINVDERVKEILNALLVGRRITNIQLKNSFVDAGIYHLLVISGLHLSLIAFLLIVVLRWFSIPKLPRYIILLFFLFEYLKFVDWRVSIVRAFLVIMFYLLGKIFYSDIDLTNTTAFAAFLLLAYEPWFIHDAGFLLTFGAVFAISSVFIPLDRKIFVPLNVAVENIFTTRMDIIDNEIHQRARRIRFFIEKVHFYYLSSMEIKYYKSLSNTIIVMSVWCLRIMLVTFSVVIFTTPVMAVFHFPISIGGLWATGPAMIVLVPILILLIMFIPLSFIWPLLSRFMLLCASVLISFLDKIAAISRITPHWTMPFHYLKFILYVLILLVVVRWIKSSMKLVLLLVVIFVFAQTIYFKRNLPRQPLARILDVGEGDSILLSFPNGSNLLIDTGGVPFPGKGKGDLSRVLLIPAMLSCGVKKIDALYLTHFDFDHCGSALGLIKCFNVKQIYCSRAELQRSPSIAIRILRLALKNNIPMIPLNEGDQQKYGKCAITVLNPPKRYFSNISNKNCLVLDCKMNSHSFLLTGDIDRDVEARIVGKYPDTRADILKCAHHGSITSTSSLFLETVRPSFVLISSGQPWRFSHPSTIILNRLRNKGIPYFTTWQKGEIMVSFRRAHPFVETPLGRNKLISNILQLYSY